MTMATLQPEKTEQHETSPGAKNLAATEAFMNAAMAEKTVKYAQWTLTIGEMDQAMELQKSLKKLLSLRKELEGTPLGQQYVKARTLAQGACLRRLTDQEVAGILETEFAELLRNDDFLPVDELEAKLLTIVLHDERDEYRRKLREALRRNQETLTRGEIDFGDGRHTAGTIGNWIQYYNEQLGTEQVDTLRLTQFLTTSKEVAKTTEQERLLLKKLFALYEYLKLSSQTMFGLEENVPFIDDDGQMKVLKKGRIEVLDLDTVKQEVLTAKQFLSGGADTAQTVPSQSAASGIPSSIPGTVRTPRAADDPIVLLRRIYQGNPAVESQVQSRMQSLVTEVQGKTDVLIQKLLAGIEAKDVTTVRAALAILARNKRFGELLRTPGIHTVLESSLKPYGPRATAQAAKDPESSVVVQLLLRAVLQDRLGLPEAEAARVAVVLANEYAQRGDERYVDLAYADTTSMTFRWSPIQQTSNDLVIRPR